MQEWRTIESFCMFYPEPLVIVQLQMYVNSIFLRTCKNEWIYFHAGFAIVTFVKKKKMHRTMCQASRVIIRMELKLGKLKITRKYGFKYSFKIQNNKRGKRNNQG